MNADNIYGVWTNGPDEAFAVTGQGVVLRYDGSAWSESYTTPSPTILFDVWGSAAADVFVAGNAGLRHFDGNTWTLMDDTIPNHSSFRGLYGFAADDVYAVGAYGDIVHYDGLGWTFVTSIAGDHLESIWGTGPDNLWAVGPVDEIIHYDGVTWESLAVTTPGNLLDVWGSGPEDIYAVGASGALHYDGATWTPVDVGATFQLESVWGSASDDVYVAVNSGLRHFDGVA